MTFDLDAALGAPFTFTFGGAEYTMPPDVDWTTANLLNDGKPDEAIRRLLGEDQWARLEASPQVFGTKAFTALLHAYMEHLGLTEGESSGSSGSSVSTGEPSKPTSKGSTGRTSPGSVTVLTG